jgi:hypothetical protein
MIAKSQANKKVERSKVKSMKKIPENICFFDFGALVERSLVASLEQR